MAEHEFTVSDAGITPKYRYSVKQGDTLRFIKSGANVLGVEVTVRYVNKQSISRSGTQEFLGVTRIEFPAGVAQATVDKVVQVTVNQPTAFELEPLFVTQPFLLNGGPMPTEKGSVVVVGGDGPVPVPEKPERILLMPSAHPAEQRP